MSHNQNANSSDATFELLEGALLISDAHYDNEHSELKYLLEAVFKQTIQTPQLLLMGDIFDLLFSPVTQTKIRNHEMITLINQISNKIEVLYFEGNHDYLLQNLFPNVKVFPLRSQPVLASYHDKKVYLSHGDYAGTFGYRLYTFVIRSRLLLTFLNMINERYSNFIIKKLDNYLSKKDQCKRFEDFEIWMKKRFENIKLEVCDTFIEGHHHQNRSFKIDKMSYINLGAFACNQRYYIVKSENDIELQECFLDKNYNYCEKELLK
jgi:UDP-2,3-diacylglucosamine hydrolase